MPLDRSNAHAQENGNSGPKGLKLVLRLDKNKGDPVEKDAPSSNDRPKRTTTKTPSALDHDLSSFKIPKKPGVVPEEPPVEDDHRPSRKRKSTQDSNFVFDPIYSNKKEGEEDEEEDEEADHKKPKKKTHRHESIPTPPLTDHDTHSGFKLKLKLPKPMLPDTPDHSKGKKPEVSSGEGKKKKRGEEMDDLEAISPRTSSGVKLKIKNNDTPHSMEKKGDSAKKAKSDPLSATKKLSPPKREELEKKELKIEPRERRERPKPEPKGTPVALDEDSAKMRKHLSGILAQLIKLDRQMYFMEPVTEDIAPQYFSIIHHPMDFLTMKKKLKDGKYNSVDALQSDFQLICNNCMTYNPAATTYAREAKRMLTTGNRLIEKFVDGTPTPSTTEHKPDAKKDSDKTPTRQALPVTTPNKNFQAKPSPSTNTPNRPAPTPPNSNLGVAFPISSGQLSSMQHPITPQQSPYPTTPPMRKPPAAYPPLTPPYSQRLPMQANPNLPPPMRPPPTMPIQKSMSTNSIFQRPNMGPPAPPPLTPNAPPRPQNPVGKPGSRPPVVSMGDNQATQTQAMYPEQPKRKYVKLPVEEPPKPAPPLPVAKTPAKLVAKVGNVPLVSPANIPGSFVYSMYIPRFESDATKTSSTETAPTTPTSGTPASPPITSTTSTTTTTTTTTTTDSTTSTSPLDLPSPTIKTASGNTAINLASINYISNYVSVPSLHNVPPAPSPHDADDAWLRAPAKRVEENVELMEEIAQDCLDSMDADTRTQMLGFFNSLVQTPTLAQPLAFPKCATQALLPIKPIHQTRPSPATPAPTSPAPPTPTTSITGNPLLDAELAEQMAKLDSLELTSQDLKQLQGLQLDVDLSSFLPPDSTPAAPNSPENSTTTTTTTTSVLSSSVSSPPTSPSISNNLPPPPTGPTDKVKASKIVQEILDKNLEHLWSLQLMQHERVANAPSEGELKLASQICDGLFVLGTSIPPSMLTTKEAVRSAIEQSGLLTGKYRHMRV